MSRITKFMMQDVRCFAGRQEFNIRPLTFLVGENSTGKSTALGCLQALLDYGSGGELDFNIPPYSMGSFVDIVTRRRPAASQFQLGYEFATAERESAFCTITVTAKEGSAEPMVQSVRMKFSDGEVVLEHSKANSSSAPLWEIDPAKTKPDANIFHIKMDSIRSFVGRQLFLFFFASSDDEEFAPEVAPEGSWPGMAMLQKFLARKKVRLPSPAFAETHRRRDTFSFAPIRSRPARTYDPLKEDIEDPEGGGVPMFLMRLKSAKRTEWEDIRAQLMRFGASSGLFKEVEIKKHGKSMSDPFQVRIKVRGPRANMMDVGYGVNQILPILVRIFTAPRGMRFLLQQPEVHLHPRGQAELVSLFAALAKSRKHAFIVETHSDHMIDRARIEIMRGNIAARDVSLIYLHPKGAHVEVHNMRFDRLGNLLEAPPAYREFFLRETDLLLGAAIPPRG